MKRPLGTLGIALLACFTTIGFTAAVPALAQVPSATASQAGNVSPSIVAASPQEAAKLAENVQNFYDKTKTFKSEFSQEFFVKAFNKKKTSKGRVTFAKPGRMEWIYDEPKDNRVVSDGAQLKVYEAENKQMFEQTVDKSQYPAALAFLTGQGKLTDHFTFEMFDGDKMNFPGGSVLVGNPKAASPAYSKVLLYVDTQTFQVRRVLIIDAQGNRNRFDFGAPKVNEAVTDAQFKFTPPPGTSIVHP